MVPAVALRFLACQRMRRPLCAPRGEIGHFWPPLKSAYISSSPSQPVEHRSRMQNPTMPIAKSHPCLPEWHFREGHRIDGPNRLGVRDSYMAQKTAGFRLHWGARYSVFLLRIVKNPSSDLATDCANP